MDYETLKSVVRAIEEQAPKQTMDNRAALATAAVKKVLHERKGRANPAEVGELIRGVLIWDDLSHVNLRPRVDLNFMVVPEHLATQGFVKDGVRVRILQPDSEWLADLLGESGKRLARVGAEFIFERGIALGLISEKVAEKA